MNRATLLAALRLAEHTGRPATAAAVAGYELDERRSASEGDPTVPTRPTANVPISPPDPSVAATPLSRPLRAPLLGAAVLAGQLPAPGSAEPDSLAPPQPLTPSDWRPAPGTVQAPRLDWVPKGRREPALRRLLAVAGKRQIDTSRLTRRLAVGDWPQKMPLRTGRRLAPQVWLVLDFSEGLAPYAQDMHTFAEHLLSWLGASAVSVRVVIDEAQPLSAWEDWKRVRAACQSAKQPSMEGLIREDWIAPPADTRVLLISDLALFRRSPDRAEVQARWLEWHRQVSAQGAKVQVLAPMPLHAETPRRVSTVHWSASSHLREVDTHRAEAHESADRVELATQLASLAAFCPVIDPGLLRSLRQLMGPQGLDAGLEHLAWEMLDAGRGRTLRAQHPDQLAALRQHWQQRWARHPGGCQQALAVHDTARDHWMARAPAVAHAVSLAWSTRAPAAAVDQRRDALMASQLFHRRLAQPGSLGAPGRSEQAQAFAQQRLRWADAHEMAAASDLFVPLYAQLQHSMASSGRRADAGRMDPRDQARALARGRAEALGWLCMDPASQSVQVRFDDASRRPRTQLLLRMPIEATALAVDRGAQRHWLVAEQAVDSALTLADLQGAMAGFSVHTPGATIRVAPVARPRGVASWQVSQGAIEFAPEVSGLFDAVSHELEVAIDPHHDAQLRLPPSDQALATRQLNPLGWMYGLDDYGVFLKLVGPARTIGVFSHQIFRFVEPGTFLMGSQDGQGPSDEHPRHAVTLTQGLWLADTPCTQALWKAVMGNNPSHFKDRPDAAERPVEQVSWEDVQAFLARLKVMLPEGLEPALPTEAEWEYACRAGSHTVYAWGDTFDPERANVAHGEGALGETSAVKQYAPNAWGLYDMHGNVWELCADGWRDYSEFAATDPRGPERPVVPRVLRGGSWIFPPAYASSAYRHLFLPALRGLNFGFRLALRSTSPGPGGPSSTTAAKKNRTRRK